MFHTRVQSTKFSYSHYLCVITCIAKSLFLTILENRFYLGQFMKMAKTTYFRKKTTDCLKRSELIYRNEPNKKLTYVNVYIRINQFSYVVCLNFFRLFGQKSYQITTRKPFNRNKSIVAPIRHRKYIF